jgi:triacylglycerol lipase
MTVVLVDGIWGTGAIFEPLRARLTAHGHPCLVPSLQPANARYGIADLAGKLKRFIDSRVEADSMLAIVGFSMGSIVARYYLQQLGGHHRTKAFFALSGPHRGTWTAYGYIGQGARDLRPGSTLLRTLDSSSSCLSSVALHAYWTPLDLMILPATSAQWRQAANLRIVTPLHRFMPGNPRVQSDILRHLQRLRSRPVPTG